MNWSLISKWLVVLVAFVALSGCSVHSRHSMGHHHSSVQFHGHVHGKPSRVLGAIVAGAIIGHAIESIAHRQRHESDANQQVAPGDRYYLQTLDGRCLWVEVDDVGNEVRTEVEDKYCRSN